MRGLGYLSSLSGTVLAPAEWHTLILQFSPYYFAYLERPAGDRPPQLVFSWSVPWVVPRPEVWLPLRVLCCSGRRQYSTNYGPDRLTCLPSLRRVPGELSLYNQQLDYNLLSPSLLLILLLLLDIVIVSRNLITIRTFLFSEMSNIS